MDDFAVMGYRTLMFAMKELSSLTTQKSLENCAEEDIESQENQVTLLGITALEDLLQDNVAECIKDFTKANIKVWMLTGDKGETAHTIAISCGLIDDKYDKVFNIDNPDKNEITSSIQMIK